MQSFLSYVAKQIPQNQRTVLISDRRVFGLYGKDLVKGLGCMDTIIVPESEDCKTRETKAYVEDRLMELGVGRRDALIALGGGALCDLVGFVAATYMRGIEFYCIPTTLLAMADACIGGKCAINTPFGKNMLGAFYEPKDVLCSTYFLRSLPKKSMQAAMAEVIKYAIVLDKKLFSMLEGPLEPLIDRCQSIKKRVVALDRLDKGVRAVLNFGHTIGHAVESLSGYRLTHGEAVSIGICAELKLSHYYYGFSKENISFVTTLLKNYQLPTSYNEYCIDEILQKTLLDKKSYANPRFVMTKKLGECKAFKGSYLKEISISKVKKLLCEY